LRPGDVMRHRLPLHVLSIPERRRL
jgi:hypothetical protein